jgi:hypothetical protein
MKLAATIVCPANCIAPNGIVAGRLRRGAVRHPRSILNCERLR